MFPLKGRLHIFYSIPIADYFFLFAGAVIVFVMPRGNRKEKGPE